MILIWSLSKLHIQETTTAWVSHTPIPNCQLRWKLNRLYTCLVCSLAISWNRSLCKLTYGQFAISTRDNNTNRVKTHCDLHTVSAKFSPNLSADTTILQHNERIIPQRRNFDFQSFCFEDMNKFESWICGYGLPRDKHLPITKGYFLRHKNGGHVRLTREVWV